MEAIAKCGLCGEPMPPGEEMFNYHGHSGPCPKPPLQRASIDDLQILRNALERGHRFIVIVEPIDGNSSARQTNTDPKTEAQMLGRAYRAALDDTRDY